MLTSMQRQILAATLITAVACDPSVPSLEESCASTFSEECREALEYHFETPVGDGPQLDRYYHAIWRDISFPAVATTDRRIFTTDLKLPEVYDDIVAIGGFGDQPAINSGMVSRLQNFRSVTLKSQDEADSPGHLGEITRRSGKLTLYTYFSTVDEWMSANSLLHEEMHYGGDGHIPCPWDETSDCDETLDQSYGSNVFTIQQLQAAYITGDLRISEDEIVETAHRICGRMYRKVVEFRDYVDWHMTDCPTIVDAWELSMEAMRDAHRRSRGFREVSRLDNK